MLHPVWGSWVYPASLFTTATRVRPWEGGGEGAFFWGYRRTWLQAKAADNPRPQEELQDAIRSAEAELGTTARPAKRG